MVSRRILKSGPICGTFGAIAIGAATQAWAANLLTNPGFVAPTAPQNTSSVCTGWTFDLDAQRATFQNHTPGVGNTWSVWCKTFEPAGGGIHTNPDIGNISPGATYTLSAFAFFETTYPTTTAVMQLGMTWLDSGGNPTGTPAFLNIDPTSNPATNVWT